MEKERNGLRLTIGCPNYKYIYIYINRKPHINFVGLEPPRPSIAA